jgi:hypothetical protein
VEHLTKLATQLFSGPVCHIDWDVESKIILALGENAGSDKQVAKSLNFDTTEHSTPAGTPRSESRSPFLSGLSPREKFSISVRNDTVKYHGDQSEQYEVDTKHSAPLLTSGSSRLIPSAVSAYSDEEIRTALACQNMRSASSTYPSDRNGALRSPSAPSTPHSVSRMLASTSASSSQLKSSTRRGFGTPGSDTILDRLRSVEGTLQGQDECNTSLEQKIQDLDEKLLMVDSSIHPAILELQQRFERELGALRRDNENRSGEISRTDIYRTLFSLKLLPLRLKLSCFVFLGMLFKAMKTCDFSNILPHSLERTIS